MLPEKNSILHSLVKLYEILLDRKTKTKPKSTHFFVINPSPLQNNKKHPQRQVPLKTSLDKLEFTLEFIPKILKHPCNNHITFHTILITLFTKITKTNITSNS